jgi:hypothetical protein
MAHKYTIFNQGRDNKKLQGESNETDDRKFYCKSLLDHYKKTKMKTIHEMAPCYTEKCCIDMADFSSKTRKLAREKRAAASLQLAKGTW